MSDGDLSHAAEPGGPYRKVRLRTRALRAAILDLDLAVANALPSCEPECYRSHSAHAPLASLALAPTDAPSADHWVPETETDDRIFVVVGQADRVGTGSTLEARTPLRHVAHESTHAAYFQHQTEHLYRVLEGPMAGTWILAVRDAEYGPVDLLMASWMIVPVHPPSAEPDLREKLAQAVEAEYRAAVEEERNTPWDETELHRDARLALGRPALVQEIVDDLLYPTNRQATLGEVLGVDHGPPVRPPLHAHEEMSLVRAVFGVRDTGKRAQQPKGRHPSHPCSAFRRDGNPCAGRAIGGDPPFCHYHTYNEK